jgi:hypothetical protein
LAWSEFLAAERGGSRDEPVRSARGRQVAENLLDGQPNVGRFRLGDKENWPTPTAQRADSPTRDTTTHNGADSREDAADSATDLGA